MTTTNPLRELAEKILWQARLARFQFAMKTFNPLQARAPAGGSDGGQWIGGDGQEEVAGKIDALKDDPYKPGGEWKLNPIEYQPMPKSMENWWFNLDDRDASIERAPTETLDPKNLKTIQKDVIKTADLKGLLSSSTDLFPPIKVVRTSSGDFIFDGNHRAIVALLRGDHIKAKVVSVDENGAPL